MSNLTRIGLIEVGSSTIRYLVADFADDMSFVTNKVETAYHNLDPTKPSERAIELLNQNVEVLVKDAATRGCDAFLAYGTAVCRAANETYPGKLTQLLKVLRPAEEAMAAWVAGFLCSPAGLGPKTTCTVIDEGNGSTEIVRATWSGKSISGVAFHSASIGRAHLAERYQSNPAGQIELSLKLTTDIKRELIRAGVFSDEPGAIYLVGGVATRIGWRLSGRSADEEYRPDEVNGVRITKDALMKFYLKLSQLYAKDPEKARLFVDTRRGREKQALEVLGSIPFLMLLANQLDTRGPYFVSGYGVRHGMAFLIKHNLLGHQVSLAIPRT